MQPRFLGQLGLADLVTALNAAVGFVAVASAFVEPTVAARLILLAAIADGLDGIVARARGGTAVGPLLDSLADVSSFAVAPAVLVFVVATDGGSISGDDPMTIAAVLIPAMYVSMAVIRLGFYMLEDSGKAETQGVQTTLAATVLAVLYLSGLTDPTILLALIALFAYLMVASITYPDLYVRDAVILGALQALAIAFPVVYNRVFPRALLLFAVAYLLLAPFVYWRETTV